MSDQIIAPRADTTVPTVCIVTFIPSPYQVELFDEIARSGQFHLQVVYLQWHDKEHPWKSPDIGHEYCILDASPSSWRRAWKWCETSDLMVFNYYTHLFPFFAMRCRASRGLPWVFWGERPGANHRGMQAEWLRRQLLKPLSNTKVPIWGVGNFALDGYKNEWGRERHYVNFPYFSDLDRFRKSPPRRAEGTFVFLYSGVLNRRKNLLRLAWEFMACVPDHPEARLWLLGDGPMESQLKELLAPVSEKVKWLGFRPWRELPAIYAQANILCHPSRYDGWALVVMEALANGLPVISTQSTGAACEFIRNGVNGWLIPTNDTRALQQSLRQALSLSSVEWEKMSISAKASVAEHSLLNGVKRFDVAVREGLNSSTQINRHPASVSKLDPLPGTHIVLASNYEPDHLYSMERYTRLLEAGLKEQGVTCTVLKPATILGSLPWVPVKVTKYLRYLDKYIFFPLALRWKLSRLPKLKRPLIHITDQGNSVYAGFVRDYPIIVTCHDLIATKASIKANKLESNNRKGSWFQLINFKVFQRADAVVCVSQKTMLDCQELFTTSGRKPELAYVYNPLDPGFIANTAEKGSAGLPESFLLHVGNSSWYKNRQGLLRIYACLRKILTTAPPLVVMGESLLREELALIDELALEPHVLHFTKPSDELILQAYQQAEALIFPSIEEGFGWPVLEAMACGCPVFTSNRAPLTEVGGDAAEYIDPENIEASARIIADRLQMGNDWREARTKAGKRQVKKFSYANFVNSMIQTYANILKTLGLQP